MKKTINKVYRIMALLLSIIIIGTVFTACGSAKNTVSRKDLILELKFDEKAGNSAKDSTGTQEAAKINYVLSGGTYQDPVDPQWRPNAGVNGGALQFDGYSNFIKYNYEDLNASGSALTLDLWVAPRAYEWSDPSAAANGEDRLTAFVSQHSKSDKEGFVFGLERHGSWSFQVGLGDRWITLWDEGNPINKYEWTKVTAVFDGNNGIVKIYKNGLPVNSRLVYESAKIASAVEAPLYIGRNSEPHSVGTFSKNMFSGLMDEVRIYKRALSDDEVKNSFNNVLINGAIPECPFQDVWFDSSILANDIYKPTYHTSAAQHWMNEPHAPVYYNGQYHLFYQFNPFGPFWQQIHWGHWVSEDMVNWRDVKEALSPTADSVAPDGIWSGAAAINGDGTPVLLFTAGDDSRKLNPRSNQNIGLAYPSDLTDTDLTEWTMENSLVVAQELGQGRSGEFRDPHVWKEGDTWYMAICSGSTTSATGTVLLYTTTDGTLKNWTYRGTLYDGFNNAPTNIYGTSWELPVILPLQNDAGNATGKYVFLFSPAPAATADNEVFYWIGNFNKSTYKFEPDFATPRLIDFGNNVFTGPSGFIDPVTGDATIFSIIQGQRRGSAEYNSGWAHNAGLARVLTLGADGDLNVRVTSNIENIVGNSLVDIKNKSLAEANAALNSVQGDTLRISLKVKNVSANKFGIYVRKSKTGTEQTSFFFDATSIVNKIGVNTGQTSTTNSQNIKGVFDGEFYLGDDNILELELYLDRSIIEGYFNNKKTITARVYPSSMDAKSIELFADGGSIEVLSLKINEMNSIYA